MKLIKGSDLFDLFQSLHEMQSLAQRMSDSAKFQETAAGDVEYLSWFMDLEPLSKQAEMAARILGRA